MQHFNATSFDQVAHRLKENIMVIGIHACILITNTFLTTQYAFHRKKTNERLLIP